MRIVILRFKQQKLVGLDFKKASTCRCCVKDSLWNREKSDGRPKAKMKSITMQTNSTRCWKRVHNHGFTQKCTSGSLLLGDALCNVFDWTPRWVWGQKVTPTCQYWKVEKAFWWESEPAISGNIPQPAVNARTSQQGCVFFAKYKEGSASVLQLGPRRVQYRIEFNAICIDLDVIDMCDRMLVSRLWTKQGAVMCFLPCVDYSPEINSLYLFQACSMEQMATLELELRASCINHMYRLDHHYLLSKRIK